MSTMCGIIAAVAVMLAAIIAANANRENPLTRWAVFLWFGTFAVAAFIVGLIHEGAL